MDVFGAFKDAFPNTYVGYSGQAGAPDDTEGHTFIFVPKDRLKLRRVMSHTSGLMEIIAATVANAHARYR
ncbi:hypothetical protein DPMN_005125 [Dreissena polymorpha]|uniref:Uncharacterized protein n=1 Tax=Dreissena polymorpha TaxID=45954 RepID=A0A9D4MTY8_DREPO|nr:hypothetical protein DPMN_005125 [Dreissena polymorpha]